MNDKIILLIVVKNSLVFSFLYRLNQDFKHNILFFIFNCHFRQVHPSQGRTRAVRMEDIARGEGLFGWQIFEANGLEEMSGK